MDEGRTSALEGVEKSIGYTFTDNYYLNTALTHSSYVKGDGRSGKYNERIEFLGDAVLGLCVGEYLFLHYPDMDEGMMTRVRSIAVRESALYEAAREFELGPALLMNRGEEQNGGREKPSILADAMEAVIGAVYLDGGMEHARKLIMSFAMDTIEDAVLSVSAKDNKSILQEYVQQYRLGSLHYDVVDTQGPDHMRTFTICVYIDGVAMGSGTGHSKQEAGQKAAGEAMKLLKNKKRKKN